MYRIVFSLGLMLINSLPLIGHASEDDLAVRDDAPRGKIVGAGRVGQQYPRLAARPDRDLRARTLDRYRGNAARYYGYNSYYGNYGGYPAGSYFDTYGNPNSTYNTYYGAYGYPTSAYNNYYGAYGNPLSGSYPLSNYDSYYGAYNPNYSTLSPYATYPNPYAPNPYANPGYNPYYSPYRPYDYPGGSMYNPNTTFVNPPSSLNYPTGYPMYSESYIY